MWISSFVITLAPSGVLPHPVAQALAAIPGFTLGARHGAKLPAVLEADNDAVARHWHDWLLQLPGVVQVDLAFVTFEPDDPPADDRLANVTGEVACLAKNSSGDLRHG
jgi:nitrate reductase NapAB chaperone NapD